MSWRRQRRWIIWIAVASVLCLVFALLSPTSFLETSMWYFKSKYSDQSIINVFVSQALHAEIKYEIARSTNKSELGKPEKLKTIVVFLKSPAPTDKLTLAEEMNSIAIMLGNGFYRPKAPLCPFKCRYTTKPADLRSADAVVINHTQWPFANLTNIDILRRPLPPDQRPAEQLYIFHSMAAPPEDAEKEVRKSPGPKRFFNHTMTYRRDATIHLPYYKVVKARGRRRNYFPDMSKKFKFGAWMVSHCYTRSGRRHLVYAIRSYVQVEIYGTCSESDPPCPGMSDDKCYQILGKTHKFYLSFENSLCEDYATEKFFFALKSDMIPVVYGQANYNLLAPPKSFIDVRDFSTIQDLAMYLKRLDQNDTEYLEYFKWKEDWEVSSLSGWEDPLCVLCGKLTVGNLLRQPSVIEDVSNWWTTTKDGRCPNCKSSERSTKMCNAKYDFPKF